jgi:preprotein translocase subunit SecY
MFSAFINSFKIPELRQRILLTLGLIFIARVGANIPLPGINPVPLQAYFDSLAGVSGGIVGMANMFTGGALLKGAVFALGIMPYISASIILQLMGAVVPSLARLQKEGETGRQKITQYTRYLTILIALVQSLLLSMALAYNPGNLLIGYNEGPLILGSQGWFLFNSVIFLTAGTVMLMWIGEQMTQRGVGNGISLLITIGILSELPGAVSLAFRLFTAPADAEAQLGLPAGVLLLLFFLLVTAGIVALTQGVRKIPVQYAKRVVGRKVFGGQSAYLPLKINYAGVMPVIFASAILMFPSQIFGYLGSIFDSAFFSQAAQALVPGNVWYYVVFGSLILGFAYFWVSLMFRPTEIADQLKANGGYIPGVRPGRPTGQFLDHVMTRLTLFGAIALTAIAILPSLLQDLFQIPYTVGQFFGGTGTLIAVGVMLDTMRQVETYLLQRHYDGFLQKSKQRRSRAQSRTKQLVDAGELRDLKIGPLVTFMVACLIIGPLIWLLRTFVEL